MCVQQSNGLMYAMVMPYLNFLVKHVMAQTKNLENFDTQELEQGER